MFICAIRNKATKAGEGMNKLVLETRMRKYKNWDRDKEENWDSFGSEIVREVSVSDEGLLEWEAMTAEEQDLLKKRL